MKRIIISALFGALFMFVLMIMIATHSEPKNEQKDTYIHKDFTSSVEKEDCYLCGERGNPLIAYHWEEDNVGIINLNTFDLLYLEINRYNDYGHPIEMLAGYTQTSSMPGEENTVHAVTCPDNGYAHVNIKNTKYEIEKRSVEKHLCQICLDSINHLHFADSPPAEYAIIHFTSRTVQPLIENISWFSAGDFGIDCEFKKNGDIDLLVHYSPVRFS